MFFWLLTLILTPTGNSINFELTEVLQFLYIYELTKVLQLLYIYELKKVLQLLRIFFNIDARRRFNTGIVEKTTKTVLKIR